MVMHRPEETVQGQGRYIVPVNDGSAFMAAGLAGGIWLAVYMASHSGAGPYELLMEGGD